MSLSTYSSGKPALSSPSPSGGLPGAIPLKSSPPFGLPSSSFVSTGARSHPGSLTPATPLASHSTGNPTASMSVSQRHYFLQLAKRFYLSVEMVCEAKEVFDRYRALEKALSTSRPASPHPIAEGLPSSPSTSGKGLRVGSRSADVPMERYPSERLPVTTSGAAMPHTAEEEERHGARASWSGPAGEWFPSTADAGGASSRGLPTDSIVEETLGVLGLQAFYLDLGIPKSALEVADVIQRMQSFPEELAMLQRKEAAERYQQEQAAATAEALEMGEGEKDGRSGSTTQTNGRGRSKSRLPQGGGGASGAEEKKSNSPKMGNSTSTLPDRSATHPSPRGEALPHASSQEGGEVHASLPPLSGSSSGAESAATPSLDTASKGLRFPLFLFLLQSRLSEEEGSPAYKDKEVLQAFRALDGDHDGVLSEEDIQRALVYLLQKEGVLSQDRDLMELACMHPIELRTAITECDMNADGLVTAEDFLMALRI